MKAVIIQRRGNESSIGGPHIWMGWLFLRWTVGVLAQGGMAGCGPEESVLDSYGGSDVDASSAQPEDDAGEQPRDDASAEELERQRLEKIMKALDY